MVTASPAIDYAAAIAQDGYFIVRGLLSPSEAAEVRTAFFALSGKHEEGLFHPDLLSSDPLERFPRVMMPHRRPDLPAGKLALQYLLDERIWSIVRTVMAEEPLAAQSMYYFKPPGARGQAFHQDNFYLRSAPKTCMAAWIAIEDIDESNGGLSVVPGSHRLPIIAPAQADLGESFSTELVEPPAGMSAVPARMKAGDVLFFGGNVIHGSTPNRSENRFRSSLIYHYIGRDSTEVSKWYEPCLTADGQRAELNYTSRESQPVA